MFLLSMIGISLAKPVDTGCDWGSRVSATATIGGVTIDDSFHNVRGPRAKRAFRELLEECNAQAAIPYFDQWRFYRQAVNVGVASGASLTILGALTATSPVGYVALGIGVPELMFHTPASAALAGMAKADMLNAIMSSERAKK
jgi:hypothetical protein